MMRFVVGFLLLTLAACARPVPPVWTEVPSAEVLLERLSKTGGKVLSLDGAATVNLEIKDKFYSTQQFVLLERPDRLRTDVLTGFGQLIMQLTADGEWLSVFLNTTTPGRFFRGPASFENLARFTRIPLRAEDMIRLLLYDPPLIAYTDSAVRTEGDQLVLHLWSEEQTQDLTFDSQLRLVESRYQAGAEPVLDVLYQKLDAQRSFPRTIRLSLLADETKVAVKFSELQLNTDIPLERFRLQNKAGLPVEELP